MKVPFSRIYQEKGSLNDEACSIYEEKEEEYSHGLNITFVSQVVYHKIMMSHGSFPCEQQIGTSYDCFHCAIPSLVAMWKYHDKEKLD